MKIICIGLNYKNHIEEMHHEFPQNPVFFLKPDSSILKNKDFWLPNFSNDIQYELELIFRIGKLGKCVQKKFAHRYIDGIGLGIDVTARDLQKECKDAGRPWEIAKAFDSSAIISDFLPLDGFANIDNINFKLLKNGNEVQMGNSSNMVFSIYDIIEYVSRFMTIKIGDIIFTGTPRGVGKLNVGDHLNAFLEDKEMLKFKVL
jgi:acylpyruvate hydrolase